MDGNIFGIALNYKCLYEKLQAQFNEKPYVNEPKKPVLFIKTPNTRNASGNLVIKKKDEILILPAVQQAKNNFDILLENRGKLLNKIEALVEQKTDGISNEIGIINLKKDKYEKGIKKYKQLEISIEDELETNEYLILDFLK